MLLIIIGLIGVASAAASAPPPPPPDYVWAAGEMLSSPRGQDATKVASLFADDVGVNQNGRVIGSGKVFWLKWRNANMSGNIGHTIGYSESSARIDEGAGELLIIDTYDTVDRSNLPPTFLADPRMATRATLYQFGADHLIHSVIISQAQGFWMKPGN